MKRIGIYDSGCGGISVLNNLLKLSTENEIFYYADSLNNPWGNKSKSTLKTILHSISNWFNEMEIDIVICGCNTTYSLFNEELPLLFNVPVYNLITKTNYTYSESSYSIIATENTTNTKIFTNTILTLNPNCDVQEVSCPGLANAIETNNFPLIKSTKRCDL